MQGSDDGGRVSPVSRDRRHTSQLEKPFTASIQSKLRQTDYSPDQLEVDSSETDGFQTLLRM